MTTIKLLLNTNMSEDGTESILGKCSLKSLTCPIDRGAIVSLILILDSISWIIKTTDFIQGVKTFNCRLYHTIICSQTLINKYKIVLWKPSSFKSKFPKYFLALSLFWQSLWRENFMRSLLFFVLSRLASLITPNRRTNLVNRGTNIVIHFFSKSRSLTLRYTPTTSYYH